MSKRGSLCTEASSPCQHAAWHVARSSSPGLALGKMLLSRAPLGTTFPAQSYSKTPSEKHSSPGHPVLPARSWQRLVKPRTIYAEKAGERDACSSRRLPKAPGTTSACTLPALSSLPDSCSSASRVAQTFPSAGLCQEREGSWRGSRTSPSCGQICSPGGSFAHLQRRMLPDRGGARRAAGVTSAPGTAAAPSPGAPSCWKRSHRAARRAPSCGSRGRAGEGGCEAASQEVTSPLPPPFHAA